MERKVDGAERSNHDRQSMDEMRCKQYQAIANATSRKRGALKNTTQRAIELFLELHD